MNWIKKLFNAKKVDQPIDSALNKHNVSGSLPSLMKIYMNANSMKYQDFVEWMRNYNGNDR